MSWKNSILGLFETKKKPNFVIFIYLRAFKISCSTQLSMKVYNLGARMVVVGRITVRKGPTVLAVGVRGWYLDIISFTSHISFFTPCVWETFDMD